MSSIGVGLKAEPPPQHRCVVTGTVRLKRDGTRAETTFGLSPKRTSPFKSAGASVQSTAGSRGVRISGSNAGYTMSRGSVRVLATHSIRQFPLHFPSRVSPCAIRFQTHSNTAYRAALSCQYRVITNKYVNSILRATGGRLATQAALGPHVARVSSFGIGRPFSKQTLNRAQKMQPIG